MSDLYESKTKLDRLEDVKPVSEQDEKAIKKALISRHYLFFDEVGRVFDSNQGGKYIADVEVE